MSQSKANAKLLARARLKRQLKDAGVRQAQVALRANVTLPHVCNILAGRGSSQPVIDAARALLAEVASDTGRRALGRDAEPAEVPIGS